MASKPQNQLCPDLTPWKPTPTQLPQDWINFSRLLAEQAKGTLRTYTLNVKYDGQRVGTLLQSWGLPWQVVMAGFLWEYDDDPLQQSGLPCADQVLSHIHQANKYYRYIERENLPPLLTPPYTDLGSLLLAVTIYFQALQDQNKEQAYAGTTQPKIDSIGGTLLNITKLLGMWRFKRQVEDVLEQIRHPQKYALAKQEQERLLTQDQAQLESIKHKIKTFYYEITRQEIEVDYTPCGIAGMERRKQDAHTTATSQKTQLSGFDVVTFDVIVPTVRECYQALGVLSQLGYIQDRVTDQIANPKPNGYSHIAFGLILKPTAEVPLHVCQLQIATRLMHALGAYGCLHPQCYELFTQHSIVEKQVNPLSTSDIWNSEKGKVLYAIEEGLRINRTQTVEEDPIVVYDKSRKPIALSKGATALDFAYKMDKAIGERAVEAFINNRKAPINRILNAGDIVEIIRASKEIQARDYWLEDNYANTHEARRLIKDSVKHRSHNLTSLNLLSQELERSHYMLTLEDLHIELTLLVERYNLGTVDDYLEQFGRTEEEQYTLNWTTQTIIRQLIHRNETLLAERGGLSWVPALDTQLMSERITYRQQHLCGFCHPAYSHDQKIKGRFHKRSGELVVHKEGCPHLIERLAYQPVLLPMVWQSVPKTLHVAFFVTAQDRKGLLLDLSRQIRSHQCDLLSFNAKAIDKFREAEIRFTVEAHIEKEILALWDNLYKVENVRSVEMNAATTPKDVYERLQKLHSQRIIVSATTTVHPAWEEMLENIQIQPRSALLKNPFDISRPVSGKMFYGRDLETRTMQRELCDSEHGRALILYGPRRSGKSSICKHFLEQQVRPDTWGIHCSLQNTTQKSEEAILLQLADYVGTAFHEQMQGSAPLWQNYADSDPQTRFKKVLQACIAQAPNARLILALDEFGGVLESHKRQILESRFFGIWKDLIYEIPQLSLIFVLPTSSHKNLTTGDFSNAFTFATSVPVQFLDTESAEQLLAEPLKEQSIAIQPNTMAKAVTLTAGNPYYVTLLGKQIIDQLNVETKKTIVTDEDLNYAVEQLVADTANQNFSFHNRELQNIEELRVLQAMIEMMERSNQVKVQRKKIVSWLELPESVTRQHLDRLRNGLILQEHGSTANPYYSFKIELVRLWLKNNRWFFSSLA
jgi:GTP pyrophosphokinase